MSSSEFSRLGQDAKAEYLAWCEQIQTKANYGYEKENINIR